jgi:hypothetical protein
VHWLAQSDGSESGFVFTDHVHSVGPFEGGEVGGEREKRVLAVIISRLFKISLTSKNEDDYWNEPFLDEW